MVLFFFVLKNIKNIKKILNLEIKNSFYGIPKRYFLCFQQLFSITVLKNRNQICPKMCDGSNKEQSSGYYCPGPLNARHISNLLSCLDNGKRKKKVVG